MTPPQPTSSDEDPTTRAPDEAEWRRFEQDVADLIRKLDPDADVAWNVTLHGRFSHTPRQVDVLIEGTLAGQPIAIAVECKRYARRLGIGAVDEFDGKLGDLGVDRGVLFGLSGYTEPARKRAEGARQPSIGLFDLDPARHRELDFSAVFTGFGDCPNGNCYTGDIWWQRLASSTGEQIEYGSCEICGTEAVRCVECEDVVAVLSDTENCWCGTGYTIERTRDSFDISSIRLEADSRFPIEFDRPIDPLAPTTD